MAADSTAEKKASKTGKKRRRVKVLAIAFAALVVIVFLLPYVLPTSWLAGIVERGLKSAVNRPVSLDGVSLGWLGTVNVENVAIGEDGSFGSGSFLSAKEIRLRVSFLDLLRKKVNVKSVTVDSPQVTIIRNREGAWNFETLLAEGGSGPRYAYASVAPVGQASALENIAVGTVRVKSGTVRFEDRKAKVTFGATDIEASVDADFSGPVITGDAKLGFDLEQGAGEGRFELAAADMRVPKSSGAQPAKDLSVTGTLKLTGIDIGEAIATAAPEYGRDLAAGKLTLSLDYVVAGTDITVTGKGGKINGLILGKAAVTSGPVKIGDVDMDVEAAVARSEAMDRLTVNELAVRTGFAQVAVSGEASLTGGAIQKTAAKAKGTVTPSALPAGLVELPAELKTTGEVTFAAEMAGGATPETWAAEIDAGGLAFTYGETARKQAGKAAKVTAKGTVSPTVLTVDSAQVALAGVTAKAGGAFDIERKAASWDLAADIKEFELSEYYPSAKGLVIGGGLTNTGKFFLETEGRKSDFLFDSKISELTLDAVDNPGVEAKVSGAVSLNSARAQAQDLVLTIAGSPLTVAALVQTPLEKPNGKVTVRGKDLSVDNALAVIEALSATVPSEEKAPSPAGKTPEEEQAEAAAKAYVKTANITLDVQVDKIEYQGFAGSNLMVDAGLADGKVTVRKAGANIFGGAVDLTADYDLVADAEPFKAAFSVAKMQSAEPAARYLSKYLPGLGFAGAVDVRLDAAGQASPAGGGLLSTLAGGGQLDITEGILSFGGLPQALAALVNVSFENLKVPEIKVPLRFEEGALLYEYVVAAGKDSVFVEGKTLLAGGHNLVVGFVPGGSSAKIRLFTVANGKQSFIKPEQVVADLAKASLSRALGGKTSGETEEKSTEEKLLEGLGGLLDSIEKKEE